jgi:hypothetical protein
MTIKQSLRYVAERPTDLGGPVLAKIGKRIVDACRKSNNFGIGRQLWMIDTRDITSLSDQ